MENTPERKTLKKRFAAIPAIVAFVVAFLAFSPHARQTISNLTKTDSDIRADIEKTFMDLRTYQALKAHYPQEYETLVTAAVQDVRNGTSERQAAVQSAGFTANLRRQNATSYGMASVESMRLSLRAQIPTLNYLKTAYGFKACNEMAVNGGVAMIQSLGSQFLNDTTLLKLTDEASGYFFETTAEGKKLRLQHQQPTEADWQVVGEYLLSKGMTQDDFDYITESKKHMDDPRLCDVTIQFFDGITTMDNDAAKRIVPYFASAAAAG
jgi:hypothetical protein